MDGINLVRSGLSPAHLCGARPGVYLVWCPASDAVDASKPCNPPVLPKVQRIPTRAGGNNGWRSVCAMQQEDGEPGLMTEALLSPVEEVVCETAAWRKSGVGNGWELCQAPPLPFQPPGLFREGGGTLAEG